MGAWNENAKEYQQRRRAAGLDPRSRETPEQRANRLAAARRYTKRWRETPNGRAKERLSHVRRKYGMGEEEYTALLHAQDFKCAVCGTDEPGRRDGESFAVDHDHLAGHVRGLLCIRCNVGIGQLRDDPALIMKAADYLLKDNLKNHG